jgi:hypothetical protein
MTENNLKFSFNVSLLTRMSMHEANATDCRVSIAILRELQCILPKGGAIVQAVSLWLPTAAARVRARVWSSEICGGQSGAGAGFLRVLRFPLLIFIPPHSPSS